MEQTNCFIQDVQRYFKEQERLLSLQIYHCPACPALYYHLDDLIEHRLKQCTSWHVMSHQRNIFKGTHSST